MPVHARVYEVDDSPSTWRELHVDLRLIPGGPALPLFRRKLKDA